MKEEQFLRLSRLIGEENVNLLHGKKVLVAGLGAVGGHTFEALVRSGVGHFRIVDFDTFCLSNLNRQILALHSSVNRRKVDVAKERALDIYPAVEIEAIDARINEDNAEALVEGMDLVLDCIDDVNGKIALLKASQKKGIKLISSMGAALRRDLSQIRVAKLKDTAGCPLARSVRQRVKKEHLKDDYTVVYSSEQVLFNYSGENEENNAGRKRTLGSLPTVTATFAQYMANEALIFLVGKASFFALHQ